MTFTTFGIISDIKSPLSGLGQFLANKNTLKIMKDAFYFILKALFFLDIFNFLSSIFGYVEASYYNTHIAQYLMKKKQSSNEI